MVPGLAGVGEPCSVVLRVGLRIPASAGCLSTTFAAQKGVDKNVAMRHDDALYI